MTLSKAERDLRDVRKDWWAPLPPTALGSSHAMDMIREAKRVGVHETLRRECYQKIGYYCLREVKDIVDLIKPDYDMDAVVRLYELALKWIKDPGPLVRDSGFQFTEEIGDLMGEADELSWQLEEEGARRMYWINDAVRDAVAGDAIGSAIAAARVLHMVTVRVVFSTPAMVTENDSDDELDLVIAAHNRAQADTVEIVRSVIPMPVPWGRPGQKTGLVERSLVMHGDYWLIYKTKTGYATQLPPDKAPKVNGWLEAESLPVAIEYVGHLGTPAFKSAVESGKAIGAL